MKGAAVTNLAIQPNAATHEFHEAHTNSEPQSGATVFPSHGAIGL